MALYLSFAWLSGAFKPWGRDSTKFRSRRRAAKVAQRLARVAETTIQHLEQRLLFSWTGATSGSANDSAHDYNNLSNWSSGSIEDMFSGTTLTANTTLYLTADHTTGSGGLNLGYSGNVDLTIESDSTTDRTLTLGGDITGDFGGSSHGRTVTLGSGSNAVNVDLAGSQNLNVQSNDSLVLANVVSDGSITKASGGTLELNGVNTFAAGTTLSAGTLKLNGSGALGAATGSLEVNSGTLDLNGTSPTVGILIGTGGTILNNASGTASTLSISGVNPSFTLSGSYAGIIADHSNGNGTTQLNVSNVNLTLAGANTYTAGTAVNSGTLQLSGSGTLGSTSAPLHLNGGMLNLGGVSLTVGSLNGSSPAKIVNAGGNSTLTITSGTNSYYGQLQTMYGSFGVTVSGTAAFTYGGSGYSGSVVTVAGGTFRLGSSGVINNCVLIVNSGVLDLNGTDQTLWGLGGTGGTILNNATGTNSTLTVTQDYLSTGTFAGVLADHSSGTGTVSLVDSTNLTLTGVNTATGSVNVQSGAMLQVDGSLAAPITVDSGGTLRGSGAITGAVTIAAGGIALAEDAGSSTGQLSTGSLTLQSGSNFNATINGSTAGSGYDQVNVSGSVHLTGAYLNLTGTRTNHDGDQLVLINNDGTDAVTGTFANQPQGSRISLNGVNYFISYHGGTGNDVVLVDSTPPVAANVNYNAIENQTLTLSASQGVLSSANAFNGLDLSIYSVNGSTGAVNHTIATTHGSLTLNDDGSLTYVPEHDFVGVDDVTFYVATDGIDVSNEATVQFVTADAALRATGTDFNANTSDYLSTYTVASFTDDAGGNPSEYSVDINWGDNSTTGGWVVSDGNGGWLVQSGHMYYSGGLFDVQVTVQDSGGQSTVASATATVTAPPLSVTGQSIGVDQGNWINVFNGQWTGSTPIATFTDPDENNNPNAYLAQVAWGDGTVDSGLWVTGDGSGNFSIIAAHCYSSTGTFSAVVTVSDWEGSTGSGTATITVFNPPTVTPVPITAAEGESFTAHATISDSNPDALVSQYQAHIDWGDGGYSLANPYWDSGSNAYALSASHSYADVGPHYITYYMNYGGLGTSTATTTATVSEAPLSVVSAETINRQEGTVFNQTLATFYDPALVSASYFGGYGAWISWGDGTSSPYTMINTNSDGTVSVVGEHMYAAAGSYTVFVGLNDSSGNSPSASATINVADAALTAGTSQAISATEGQSFTGTVASFTDADPNANTNLYTATIDWGDGNTSAGSVTPNNQGGFDVVGTNTYTTAGSFSPIVTITDIGGVTLVIHPNALYVTDAPLTPTNPPSIVATEGQSFSGAVESFTDGDPNAVASMFRATIEWSWGSGSSSDGTIQANGQGGFDVIGTHTYSNAGSDAAWVWIQDIDGATVNTRGTVSIADAPLTAVSTPGISAVVGQSFTGTVARFTDADPNSVPSDFTASIDWNDGTSSDSSNLSDIQISAIQGGFHVDATHTYASPGDHSATVTITDLGGSTASQTSPIIVSKATPTITWNTPTAITYGTPLNGAQLDATASVPGSFVYSRAVGTVPGVGTNLLSVVFTPTDSTDYTTATDSVSLKVCDLALTASPSAQAVEGQPFSLSLSSDGAPAIIKWIVAWNDPNAQSGQATTELDAPNGTTLPHTFGSGTAAANVDVTAYDSIGDTFHVSPVHVAFIPAGPSGLVTSVASNTEIDLSWADRSAIAGHFLIQRSTDGVNFTTIGTTLSGETAYSDVNSGFVPGAAYYYRVLSGDAAGYSLPSPVATAAMFLPGLSGLHPTIVSGGQVTLAWINDSANETGVVIERSLDGLSFAQIGIASANSTLFTDTGVSGGTSYWYRAKAVNGATQSYFASIGPVLTPPIAPSDLSVTAATASSIALTWGDVPGANGFEVDRSPNGNSLWMQIGSTGIGGVSFIDQQLPDVATYFYRVSAKNASGNSAPSHAIPATLGLSAPTDLSATAISGIQVELSWKNSSDNENGFEFWQQVDGGSWSKEADFGGTTTSWTDTTVQPGHSYGYKVVAYRNVDNTRFYSAYTNPVTVSTPSLAAPNDLTATVLSGTQIELFWKNNTHLENGFELWQQIDGGNWSKEFDLGITCNWTDTTVQPAHSYSYEVRARRDDPLIGQNAYSAFSNVAVPEQAGSIDPSDLTAIAVNGTQIDLYWKNNSDNEDGVELWKQVDGGDWNQDTEYSWQYGSTTSWTDRSVQPGHSYGYKVVAYHNVSSTPVYSAYTDPVMVATPGLAAPSDLTATLAGEARINLRWKDNSDNEDVFELWQQVDGGSWSKEATPGGSTTSYTDNSVQPGHSYSYEVRARRYDSLLGQEAYSTYSTIATVKTVLGDPSNLTVFVSAPTKVVLIWSGPAVGIMGVSVERRIANGSSSFSEVQRLTDNPDGTYTDSSVSEGVSYQYRIRVVNGSVFSSYTNTATVLIPPTAPSTLTATAVTDSQITLGWTIVSTAATGYIIQRSQDNITWNQIKLIGATLTNFIDRGLSDGTLYYYRLQATGNTRGPTCAILSTRTLTAGPSNLIATGFSGGQVTFSWHNNSTTATAIYVDELVNGYWSHIGGSASISRDTTSTLTVRGQNFAPATTYSFRAYASGPGGNSPLCAGAVATTGAYPIAPSNLVATPLSDSQIRLTWSDNSNNETGFVILRSQTYGGTFTQTGTASAGATSYSDTSVSEGHGYYYQVYATNAGGNSAPTASAYAYTLPVAPSGLGATYISSSRIDLSWTNNSGNSFPWYIYQSTDGTNWSFAGNSSGNTFQATGPFDGSTTYSFQVRSSSSSLYSASNKATAATAGYPKAPFGLSATALSDSQIHLTWSDNSNNETGFVILRSTDYSSWTSIPVGPNVTTYTDSSGLSEGQVYYYQVYATNAVGNSAPSTYAYAYALTKAPSGLSVTLVSPVQVNLTWTNNSAVSYFCYIYQSTDGTNWRQVGYSYGNAFQATGPFDGSTTYYFQIKAYGYYGGISAPSGTASVTTAGYPRAPSGLTATALSDSQIHLTWSDNSNNETEFVILRSQTYGGTYTQAGTAPADATGYSDTGLSDGQGYYYQVYATNAVGDSVPNTYAYAYALTKAPSGLSATLVSPIQVNLTWTNNSAVSYYSYIYQSTDGTNWSQVGNSYSNTFEATGPFNGSTTYYFQVKAYGYGGNSAPSSTASVTTAGYPKMPSGLTATALSDSQISLTWSDNSNNETGFVIQRSTNYNGSWTSIPVGPNITTYIDGSGLSEGQGYYYQVYATNAVGNSALTYTYASTLPKAASGLSATLVSPIQVNLTWTNNSAVSNYSYIYQSTDGTSWSAVGYSYGNTFQATGPFDGSTTYYFHVKAYGYGGNSVPSGTANVTTAGYPKAPSGLTATALSDSQIHLTWSDNSNNETGFVILRSQTYGGTYTQAGTASVGATSYSDTSVSEGQGYYYQVYATNAVGSSLPVNTYSPVYTFAKLIAPSMLSAVTSSSATTTLTWFSNSTQQTGFVVQRSSDGINFATTGTSGANVSWYMDNTCSAGTSYYYRVQAVLGVETSAFSGIVHIVTIPFAPAVSAIAVLPTRITVSWNDVPGEAGFVVERSPDGVTGWTTIGAAGIGVLQYSDLHVNGGLAYYYRVAASNAWGTSIASVVAGAITPLGIPNGLTATATSSSAISLAWTDNSTNETGFKVERATDEEFSQNLTLITTTVANAEAYLDTGLSGSATYYYRVRATNGTVDSRDSNTASATTSASQVNQPPTILAGPSISNLTATTVALSIQATDDGGEANLTYTWSITDPVSDADPIFANDNGTNAAKNTTVTFQSGGTWHFVVTISDGTNTTTAAVASAVAVAQVLSSVTISSAVASIPLTVGTSTSTASFNAVCSDQFGRMMADPSNLSWSNSGAGNISSVGVYTAPATGTADDIAAASGGIASNVITLSLFPANTQAPANLAATVSAADQIDLSWTNNSTSLSGNVVWVSMGGGAFTALPELPAGQSTYSLSNLTPDVLYAFKVTADYGGAVSASSATITATPIGATLTATGPSTVTEGASYTLDVAATTPVDGVSSPIDHWLIDWHDGTNGVSNLETVPGSSGSTVGHSFPSGLQAVDLSIAAVDAEGRLFSLPNKRVAILPLSVGNLIATTVSSSAISLSWTNRSQLASENDILISTDGTTFSRWDQTTASAASYQATGLQAATTYYFEVSAVDSAESTVSNPSSATTSAITTPTGLTATVISAHEIDLSWSDSTADATSFELQWSADQTKFTPLGTVTANSTSYQAKDMSSGTLYTFRVRAVAANGGSAYSYNASAQTLPPAPTGLYATRNTNGSVSLSWNSVAAETGFVIQRRAGSGAWSQIGTTSGLTTFGDNAPADAAVNSYRVEATSVSASSEFSDPVIIATPPLLPQNFTATLITSNGTGASLSWQSGGGSVDSYLVQRSTDSGFESSSQFSVTGNSYADTGLATDSTYYYRVLAHSDVAGDSQPSAVRPILTVPAAPSSLQAAGLTSGTVNLNWSDNSTTETGFSIEMSADSGTSWFGAGSAATNAEHYTLTGLSSTTSYSFRVRAVNASGSSSPSDPAAATPISSAVLAPDLFGTGLDSSGQPLGVGASDPHYSPGVVCTPAGPWVGGQWISLAGNPTEWAGAHSYSTTFTVPAGIDPANLFLFGSWSSDNRGTQIFLNGIPTGNAVTDDWRFQGTSGFSISSGFQTGKNTLRFDVQNNNPSDGESPTGLLVGGMSLSYNVSQTVSIAATVGSASVDHSTGTVDDAQFTFMRTGSTDAPLPVQFVVSNTANPAGDYQLSSGTASYGGVETVTIPAGSSSVTVRLTPQQTFSGTATATLFVWGSTGYAIGTKDASATLGNTVRLHIDSNNNGQTTAADDPIRDDPNKPGKIVVVNSIDRGGDGIPDFADGLANAPWSNGGGGNNDYARFVPVVVTLANYIDPTKAQLQFAYNGSDPHLVTVPNTANGGYGLPAQGNLRLWTKDGNVQRNDGGISDGGDYIAPDTAFDASKLSWTASSWGGLQATIYLEAVRPGSQPGNQTIEVKVNPGSQSGSSSFAFSDTMRVTAVQDTVTDYMSAAPGDSAQNAYAANPGGMAYDGNVRLSDGIVRVTATDFSDNVQGLPWGQTRTWTTQPGLLPDGSASGNRWTVSEWPHLVQGTSTMIAVLGGSEVYFDEDGQGSFVARYFSKEKLTFDGSHYTLADTMGNQYVFNDFSLQDPSDATKRMYERGGLVSFTDANGISATVSSWDDLGNITEIDRGSDHFVYTYNSPTNDFETLKMLQVKRAGAVIAEVDYTYYQGSQNGNAGDLRSAIVRELNASGNLVQVGGSYYRYKPSASGAGGLLTYAASGGDYKLLLAAAGSDAGLDGLAESTLKKYATYAFAYDGQDRAISQTVQGMGASWPTSDGTVPTSTGTRTYNYNDAISKQQSFGINVWNHKTTVTRADGNTETDYLNFAGEVMLTALTIGSTPQTWMTFHRYDAQGRLLMTAAPSATIPAEQVGLNTLEANPDLFNYSQTTGTFQYLNASQGVIERIEYYGSSDAAAGYVKDTSLQHGQSGTRAFQDYYKYEQPVSATGITLYPITSDTRYTDESTAVPSGAADERTTTFVYSYSGTHLSQVTTTLPTVSTDQNGTGQTTTTTQTFDTYGHPDQFTNADNYVTATQYDSNTGLLVGVTDGAYDSSHVTQFDAYGRPTQSVNANGNITNISYTDGIDISTVRTTPALGPVEVTLTNWKKSYIETYTEAGGTVLSLAVTYLDAGGRVMNTRSYFDLAGLNLTDAALLAGDPPNTSNRYYTTSTTYDSMGRLASNTDALGTTTATIYDALGRVTEVQKGGTTLSDATYDSGHVGDGNLTRLVSHPGFQQPDRTTTNYYDWRDRLEASSNGISLSFNTLNNIGETTSTAVYDAALSTVDTTGGNVQVNAGNGLMSKTHFDIDSRGQVYRVTNYGDSTTAALDQTLVTNLFHDGRGNVIETDAPGGVITKTHYNGDNRADQVQTFAGSTLIQESDTQYDGDGNAQVMATQLRQPDGSLRTSHVVNYYDAADRLAHTADFGTSGTVSVTAVPSRTNALVTDYTYDSAGFLQDTTNPRNVITRRDNDALGRMITETDNYVAGGSVTADTNKSTGYHYNGADEITQVSVNNVTSTGTVPQTTVYKYGQPGALDKSWLTETDYPDGTKETITYDNLGEAVSKVDRSTVTHTYGYDSMGRMLSDVATIIPSSLDSTVQKLSYQYDPLGRLKSATSEGPVGGVWRAINQVTETYNGFGQLLSETQTHDGASLAVRYAYALAGNSSRLLSLSYPGGRVITYNYGGTGDALDDAISRVSSISEGAQVLEQYSYLGLSTVVGRTLVQPNITETTTLDAFGRVSDTASTLGGSDLTHLKYGYDANGNLLWRQDVKAEADGHNQLDQQNEYGKLNRKTVFLQGPMDAAHQVTGGVSQVWTLDSQGNRSGNTYNAANQVNGDGYNGLDAPTSMKLTTEATRTGLRYDAWNRVVLTVGDRQRVYAYDALGRRITETDYSLGDTDRATPNLASSSEEYYDAAGQMIEERGLGGASVRDTNVWSAAGSSLLVERDKGGVRLYALHDAQGSTVAVTDASGVVQERYVYQSDGRPVALQPDWTSYTFGDNSLDTVTSRLGWEYLNDGMRWKVMFQQDINGIAGGGLYEGADGQWYDPQHGRSLQPDLSAFASGGNAYNPHREQYQSHFASWYLNAGDVALPMLQGAAAVASFIPGVQAVALPVSIFLNGWASPYASGATTSQLVEGLAIQAALAYGPLGLTKGLSYLPSLASSVAYNARLAGQSFVMTGDSIAAALMGGGNPPMAGALAMGGIAVMAGDAAGALEGVASSSGWGNWGADAASWTGVSANAIFSIGRGVENIAGPTASYRGLRASRDLIQGQGAYVLKDPETGQVLKIGSARDFDVRFQEYRAIEAQTGRELEVDLYHHNPNGSFAVETALRDVYEASQGTLFWDGTGTRAGAMGFAPGEFNLRKLLAQDPNFGLWGWSMPSR